MRLLELMEEQYKIRKSKLNIHNSVLRNFNLIRDKLIQYVFVQTIELKISSNDCFLLWTVSHSILLGKFSYHSHPKFISSDGISCRNLGTSPNK